MIQPLTASTLNICNIFPVCEMVMIKGLYAEMGILLLEWIVIHSFNKYIYLMSIICQAMF